MATEAQRESGRAEVELIMAQLEEIWRDEDILFERIAATDAWGTAHGLDWTFADVPYHLAYFGRDLVVRGLERGPNVPPEDQIGLTTNDEIAAWNTQEFARRPPEQTPAESVRQLLATRDDLRRRANAMTDDDLDGQVWFPLAGGWVPVRGMLLGYLVHEWSEFLALRILMNRDEPVPSSDITSLALLSLIASLPTSLDVEAAQGQSFAMVYRFTNPGVSPVTLWVQNGAAAVTPGAAETADVVITQSAETFEATRRGMMSFTDAYRNGDLEVSSIDGLAKFSYLFPL